MFKDKQQKNIIKAISAVLLTVIVGEGVFGTGIYWPFLLVLLDWKWVYWMALAAGVLISAMYHIPIGLPSLFLVFVVGGLSLVFSSRKETGWVMLVVSILCNAVFDKVFGFPWSWWEPFLILAAWIVSVRWFEKTESIKINY